MRPIHTFIDIMLSEFILNNCSTVSGIGINSAAVEPGLRYWLMAGIRFPVPVFLSLAVWAIQEGGTSQQEGGRPGSGTPGRKVQENNECSARSKRALAPRPGNPRGSCSLGIQWVVPSSWNVPGGNRSPTGKSMDGR